MVNETEAPTLDAAPKDDAVERLGVIMLPDAANEREAGGVLNPAGMIGPHGETHLFPRLVALPNVSRVGIARVLRDACNRPVAVERRGVALAPSERYEKMGFNAGGCEDPRVTWLENPGAAVMAYTALGQRGPRPAIASSRTLTSWTRHGLIDFAPERGFDWNDVDNKDVVVLPRPVRGPERRPCLAVAHRPMFTQRVPVGLSTRTPSLWMSYMPWTDAVAALRAGAPLRLSHHTLVATPEAEWESFRVGWGSVPLETNDGLLAIYHGVERTDHSRYCAGALLLDPEDPRRVIARTPRPFMTPAVPEEREGVVNDVVFPTYVEKRDAGYDIYYGMGDAHIGVAHIRESDLLARLAPVAAHLDVVPA